MSVATPQDAQQQYLDNCGYDVNNSASQCALFIQACRALIVLMPRAHGQDRSQSQFTPDLVQGELQRALAWLAQNPVAGASPTGAGGVRHFDLSNYRGEFG